MKKIRHIIPAFLTLLAGCASTAMQPERYYVAAPIQVVYQVPASQAVVSVYVEPQLYQPAPVLVKWAPPPMLVESVPHQPYQDAVWTGGYWVWEGNWVWARGRWSAPPQAGYGWVNPYYENRAGSVLFVDGFWAAPGVVFVRPAFNIKVGFAQIAAGVIAGVRPIGPDGIFVPAPPGSRFGLIVPAPLGTAPAVLASAPPVVNDGMRIHVTNNSNNTYINNSTAFNNVDNNITNVTIVAPASATANGQAINQAASGQVHLAAALTPVVHALAPVQASAKPIAAYVAGRTPTVLPAAQIVRITAVMTPARARAPEVLRLPAPPALVHAVTAHLPTAHISVDKKGMRNSPVPSSRQIALAPKRLSGAERKVMLAEPARSPAERFCSGRCASS